MCLVKAFRRRNNSSKIDFSFEPSSSRFSFANGEQSNVREKLVINFQNGQKPTGRISTAMDILDQRDVPILFSVEQLRNLRMSIEHTPACDYLTCPLFGLKRFSLPVSTSNHNVLDAMMFASSVRTRMDARRQTHAKPRKTSQQPIFRQ